MHASQTHTPVQDLVEAHIDNIVEVVTGAQPHTGPIPVQAWSKTTLATTKLSSIAIAYAPGADVLITRKGNDGVVQRLHNLPAGKVSVQSIRDAVDGLLD